MILHFLEWKKRVISITIQCYTFFYYYHYYWNVTHMGCGFIHGLHDKQAITMKQYWQINEKNMLMYINQNRSIFFAFIWPWLGLFLYKMHEKRIEYLYKKKGWMKYYSSRTVILQTKEKTDNTNGTTTVQTLLSAWKAESRLIMCFNIRQLS